MGNLMVLTALGFIVFLVYGIKKLVEKKPAKRIFLISVALLFISFVSSFFIEDEKQSGNAEPATTTVDNEQKEEDESDDLVEDEIVSEVEEEPEEISPQQQMIQKITNLIYEGKAYDVGSYIQGDIPKGEYAFVRFDGSGEYFSEEDAAGNIIDNENFDSFGYVYVHGVGNISTSGLLVSTSAFEELEVTGSKELYEIINKQENYEGSAWYKVGIDIPGGKYVIESLGEGYVAVMSGPVGNNEIINNELFNGKYSINVSDGQYLVVSRATIIK